MAILGPKNGKTGIQIMQTEKGFKKSLLVILHLESNLRVLCVLDFRNSPLISLNLPNYVNYFNYLARLITL